MFESHESNDYTVAVVKNSFLNGSSWSLDTARKNMAGDYAWNHETNPSYFDTNQAISAIQSNVTHNSYEYMNLTACFNFYNSYFSPQGNVVILVKNESVQLPEDDSLLVYADIVPRFDNWPKNLWAVENSTGIFKASKASYPSISTWLLGQNRYEASYCLVQPVANITNSCRFEYSPQIMLAVCLLNLVKALTVIIIWALRKWQDSKRIDSQKEVIYTLGDAIASFMREPDPTTRDMGLATKEEFRSKRTLKSRFVNIRQEPSQEPRVWRYEPKKWRSSASLQKWFTLVSL